MSSKNVFMSFGRGQESVEATEFPKYVGVGTFNVLAVNPSKEELEKLYDTTLKRDVEYTSIDEDGVEQIRIDFIVSSDPEKNNNIDFKTKVSFFMKNAPRLNRTGDKVQVINPYGETTWLDIEMAKTGELPENQSWFDKPYRPAFIGEEDLTLFLKAYLNIPVKSWRDGDGVVQTIENIDDAKARLSEISKYFNNDIRELKEIMSYQPNNQLKMAIGVKTTDNNQEYQTFYTKMFLKTFVKNYSRLETAIKDSQDNGAYPNTVFSVKDLHEYKVEATEFESEEDPFGSEQTNTIPGWFGDK